MSISVFAARKALTATLVGVLTAGSVLLLNSTLTSAEPSVPAAEAALQGLLPTGSKIVGSRQLDPDQAEVLVESRGQVNPVIVKRTASGQWQQDMAATLARGASDMKSLASTQIPAFGQTSTAPTPAAKPNPPLSTSAAKKTLLESSQDAVGLLPPLNKAQETDRAVSGAGRADPFQPLNVIPPTPVPITLPPLPNVTPPTGTLAPPTAVATPTPDPAAFAKSVQVSGIVQIGGDSFALVSSGTGTVPVVVQTGQKYETAALAGASATRKQVFLKEGGQGVIVRMKQ